MRDQAPSTYPVLWSARPATSMALTPTASAPYRDQSDDGLERACPLARPSRRLSGQAGTYAALAALLLKRRKADLAPVQLAAGLLAGGSGSSFDLSLVSDAQGWRATSSIGVTCCTRGSVR